MKKNHKLILFYIALTLGIVIALFLMFDNMNQGDDLVYSDLVTMFQNEEVNSFEVDEDDNIVIEKKDGTTVKYELRDFAIFYNDFSDIILQQVADGVIERYDYEPYATTPWWVSLLPTVAIIVVFAIVAYMCLVLSSSLSFLVSSCFLMMFFSYSSTLAQATRPVWA